MEFAPNVPNALLILYYPILQKNKVSWPVNAESWLARQTTWQCHLPNMGHVAFVWCHSNIPLTCDYYPFFTYLTFTLITLPMHSILHVSAWTYCCQQCYWHPTGACTVTTTQQDHHLKVYRPSCRENCIGLLTIEGEKMSRIQDGKYLWVTAQTLLLTVLIHIFSVPFSPMHHSNQYPVSLSLDLWCKSCT